MKDSEQRIIGISDKLAERLVARQVRHPGKGLITRRELPVFCCTAPTAEQFPNLLFEPAQTHGEPPVAKEQRPQVREILIGKKMRRWLMIAKYPQVYPQWPTWWARKSYQRLCTRYPEITQRIGSMRSRPFKYPSSKGADHLLCSGFSATKARFLGISLRATGQHQPLKGVLGVTPANDN